MLCDQCCAHVHRNISILEGKTVNCLAYGCEGGNCDFELRNRFDKYLQDLFQKERSKCHSLPDSLNWCEPTTTK